MRGAQLENKTKQTDFPYKFSSCTMQHMTFLHVTLVAVFLMVKLLLL
jgi:hypothetical protein